MKSRGGRSGGGSKNISYCENGKRKSGGGGVRSGEGLVGGCVSRIEVIVKI